MVLTYPYPLSTLANRLLIESVVWDLKRFDQISYTGGGDVIVTELASPKWTATVNLGAQHMNIAKQSAALIRALQGSQQFFLFDPTSKYPQYDPTGSIIGSSTVEVGAIGGGYNTLSLTGLPAAYKMTIGDKIQITNGELYCFLECVENKTANGSGVSGAFSVNPNVPVWVAVGNPVTLVKPACKCVLLPGSHNPGTTNTVVTEGQTFQVIQK